MAFDLYQMITDRMIEEMKQGIIPWRKPWMASSRAVSHVTGRAYSLLNQMILGKPGEYLTFRQIQQEGGRVRKGEKASPLLFTKWLEAEDKQTGEKKQIPFLRYYAVFHIDQTIGINPKYTASVAHPAQSDQTADAILASYIIREGITLEHREGNAAYYQPSTDRIVLPLMRQFTETAEYYGTAFHEAVHSVFHQRRLGELTDTAHFGSENYSKGELTAEIGSAALVHYAGLETSESLRNSAAYVQNWLQVLQNDKRFLFIAAAKAQKAVNYILDREDEET